MRRAVWALVIVFMAGPALAQQSGPVFKAEVDRTRLLVGERVELNLSLKGPDVSYQSPFSLPELGPYLRLVDSSGPKTQQSIQFINGRLIKSGSVDFSYLFEARKAGTVTIPAISYRVDGKLIKTSPIKVEILEPPASPEVSGGDTAWHPPTDPFLEVRVDKQEAYVGEQVVASWYLYFRREFGEPRLARVPTASDFMIADLGTASSLNPVKKRFGGETWQVAYLKSMALFPIKAGDALLESLALGYRIRTGGRNIFGFRIIEKSVESRPIKIKVKPLPDKGKPGDFSGAVGRFTIRLDRRSGDIQADTPFKFNMTITGTGHPDFIPKPEIELPEGFDIYTEAVDKETRLEKGRAIGIRQFKMILVPHLAGDFELPPFQLSYFDPVEHKYKVAKSSPINLEVRPGKKTLADLGEQEPSLVSSKGQDLRYIKPDQSELKHEGRWLLSSPQVLVLQALPILAMAASLVLRRRRDKVSRDHAYARKLRAAKRFRKSLVQANKAADAGDAVSCLAHAYRALVGFIADHYNLPGQGMTTADAVDTLRSAGLSEETVDEAYAILEECDRARFASGSVTDQDAGGLVKRAVELMKRIDRESRR